MNSPIEQLKRDIAADENSARMLEVEALRVRLEDLSTGLNLAPQGELYPDLDAVIRSYWGAMILARQAIELADRNRLAHGTPPRSAAQAAPEKRRITAPTT